VGTSLCSVGNTGVRDTIHYTQLEAWSRAMIGSPFYHPLWTLPKGLYVLSIAIIHVDDRVSCRLHIGPEDKGCVYVSSSCKGPYVGCHELIPQPCPCYLGGVLRCTWERVRLNARTVWEFNVRAFVQDRGLTSVTLFLRLWLRLSSLLVVGNQSREPEIGHDRGPYT
jgi:hypothetical protein